MAWRERRGRESKGECDSCPSAVLQMQVWMVVAGAESIGWPFGKDGVFGGRRRERRKGI